jgi:hypothetical protein
MGNEKKTHYLRVKRSKNFRVSIRKELDCMWCEVELQGIR